jgi:tryptophan-rich sensory protein
MSGIALRAKPILIALAAAFLVGALGGTMTDIGPWYQALQKPSIQPPDWLFGPAWTVIFALAGLSAATAWRDGRRREDREWLLALFSLNGFLNILWSLLFFRLQRPDWALYEVFALWLSILLLIIVIGRYSRAAALLLVPYIAWVTFATVLNWQIVELNGPF